MKGKHEKRERLGRGEFQFSGGFNVNRMDPGLNHDAPKMERVHREARFFEAVFSAEPAVMEMLESIERELPEGLEGNSLTPIAQARVAEWCSRFNLNAPWCREVGEQMVLAMWLESREGGECYSEDALRKTTAAQELAAQPFQEHRLAIEFGFWPITRMTRSEFRDECGRVLEVKFKEFCDHIEKLAISDGMERTPEKREMDHFLWLARYQVKGQNATEIKKFTPGMEHITTDAITRAIRALAKELELPLRGRESTEVEIKKKANPSK